MEETKEVFISTIEDTLVHSPEEAIKILLDANTEILESSSWDLVTRLSAHLTDKNRLEKQQVYNSCVDLLLEIAKIVSPDEVLFEYIGQAEKQTSTETFIVIMKAMQIILLRLPHRRGVAISWCCNAIIRHLSQINIPQCTKLEGDEQILENDGQVQSIESIYLEIIDFFKPFVHEIESQEYTISEKHINTYRDAVLNNLLKLFGHPLMYMDLESENSNSPFRIIAENILNFVIGFGIDLLYFLEFVNISDDDIDIVDSEFNNSSLGVFYYLIFVEGIYIDKISCIYSNYYLLNQLMWLCLSLMKLNDINAQWKGLSLAEISLNRIAEKEIAFESAHRFQCKEFAQYCTKIMIYSESRKNRVKAVPTFYKFLKMFDACGRYYMLLSIQDTIKEPGFIGYLATRTKDFVVEALATRNSAELKYFTGKCLRDLIQKFCLLENDTETDIMRYSDQIISSLNLLRYITIRDTDNLTGFLDLIPTLNDRYLTPLKKALEISRTHYELQKNEINQPTKSDSFKSITLGGMELPHLSSQQKFQIIEGALNTFDLIDSILARVIECIHDYKSYNKRT